MSSPSKIARVLVQAVDNAGNLLADKKVPCESFWQDNRAVVIFFRRFGWQFCRVAAKELSTNIKPILDQNNIRLIGIGFDSRFVKPFVEEGYFAGELYIDSEKECYNALQYKTFTFFDLMKLLFSSKWRNALSKGRSMGISGDMKGDAFQNGGALVVDKGGKLLFEYIQEDAAEQISEEQILTALKLKK